MDSKIQNLEMEMNLCIINICGMSDRSRVALDHYVDVKQIDILAIQESGTVDVAKLGLTNMNLLMDCNKAKNKGCLLFVKQIHSVVPLEKIAKLSSDIDSVWSLVICNKKRYIIGADYLKLGYAEGLNEVLSMLQAASVEGKGLELMGYS